MNTRLSKSGMIQLPHGLSLSSCNRNYFYYRVFRFCISDLKYISAVSNTVIWIPWTCSKLHKLFVKAFLDVAFEAHLMICVTCHTLFGSYASISVKMVQCVTNINMPFRIFLNSKNFTFEQFHFENWKNCASIFFWKRTV